MSDLTTNRSLRAPALRNLLYDWADGKCRLCGRDLPDDWHADHIEPWSATQRTNVFEMQALCPDCNLRKGNRMIGEKMSAAVIDTGPMRPGQRGAIQALWHNVSREKQHTGIVLPTRYGKSDVIKMGGLGLLLNNQVSRVIVLEPASLLVSQILNAEKMKESADRYGVPPVLSDFLSTYAIKKTPTKPFPPNGVSFAAMTIQMANNHRMFLADWVEQEKRTRGRVPIFFIDEAHTGSQDNQWGATVAALEKAGAFLVLLTATPYRTDDMPIEGFDYKEVSRDQYTQRRNKGIWAMEKVSLRLDPDHETTFAQAWSEKPPALCYLARIPIAPMMARVETETGEVKEKAALSKIPEYAARGELGRLVERDFMVKDGCRKLLDALRDKRRVAPTTAGIVFVGNDKTAPDEDDIETNKHAWQVADTLRKEWPGLEVLVATSTSENDPQKVIERFQEGQGDVLIVKQMGGIGMDVPRLKVALDLSTFRTANLFVQRLCRIATVWQYGPGLVEDLMLSATYIFPGDKKAVDLWTEFVSSEGGDAAVVTEDLIQEIQEAVSQEQRALPDTFTATGETVGDEEMADTEGRSASVDKLDGVRMLTQHFPEIARRRTEPEIANVIDAEGITFAPTENGNGKSPAGDDEEWKARDFNAEEDEARKTATKTAAQIANILVRQNGGAEYSEVIRKVYIDAKKAAQIDPGAPIEEMELAQLSRLAAALERRLRRVRK